MQLKTAFIMLRAVAGDASCQTCLHLKIRFFVKCHDFVRAVAADILLSELHFILHSI
jgi:hypothetical protein